MTKVSGEDLIRRLATRAVHAGHIADPLAGAVMAPIYQTSTYVQQGLGKHKGYEYARTQNPTREALERNIAALEDGRHGFAFASGLAAVDAVLKLLSQGDHVVSGENVYGGTHRQMTHIWSRHGLEFTFVDASDVVLQPFSDDLHREGRLAHPPGTATRGRRRPTLRRDAAERQRWCRSLRDSVLHSTQPSLTLDDVADPRLTSAPACARPRRPAHGRRAECGA